MNLSALAHVWLGEEGAGSRSQPSSCSFWHRTRALGVVVGAAVLALRAPVVLILSYFGIAIMPVALV